MDEDGFRDFLSENVELLDPWHESEDIADRCMPRGGEELDDWLRELWLLKTEADEE